jgi:dUTP pyrophosphatase
MMKDLRIKKMNVDAILPTRAHPTDAGMDVYALRDEWIVAGTMSKVPLGIAVDIPPGYFGLMRGRSSLASLLHVRAGIIDSGYVGELVICLSCVDGYAYKIEKGQKIGQMLILPVATPAIVEVAELDNTQRGENGFGSSGK